VELLLRTATAGGDRRSPEPPRVRRTLRQWLAERRIGQHHDLLSNGCVAAVKRDWHHYERVVSFSDQAMIASA